MTRVNGGWGNVRVVGNEEAHMGFVGLSGANVFFGGMGDWRAA